MEDGPTHVLVIDDDAAVRRMLRAFLEPAGYEVHEAACGEDAIAFATAIPFHAILLDWVLPDLDGYTVCRKFRETSRVSNSVIIILSASDSLKREILGFHAGADDYLTKPFELSELAARLSAHLRRMRSQQEKEKMLERLAAKLAMMNVRLREEATTDGLTGLYNQRYFWKHFENEFKRARRLNRPLSLIMMDLDRFKSINDQFGHAVGDSVLREIGKLLKGQLRGIDLVARAGGEEFGVILPDTHLQNAIYIAQRLRLKCNMARLSPLPEEGITLSAGIAAFPQHAETVQELYRKADQALYQAKAQGRNCVVAA